MIKIKTALISVSDKKGAAHFAAALRELGVQLISTGGTARTLEEAGLEIIRVSERTGFPEILDGRVKTLHPRIHAAILARHSDVDHLRTLEELEIDPIELVVVNLYPFAHTIAQSQVTRAHAIENIDIGGPTLVRAAAKNSDSITVVVEPGDYPRVIAEMKAGDGCVPLALRQDLAAKAFQHTAAYDATIADWLKSSGQSQTDNLPDRLGLNLGKVKTLRYGENPHQRAGLYSSEKRAGLPAGAQHQGKDLSFNNLIDMNSAWQLCKEFDRAACCIIKHNNPCGAAVADAPAPAFEKALECDPISAFGSVIAFNHSVDGLTAEKMRALFVEVVIAPGFCTEALKIFSSKKNLRVIEMPWESGSSDKMDIRSIEGGFLVQDSDVVFTREEDLRVVSKARPKDDQIRDLLFSWTVCKHVKSNAIVLARDEQTLGVGAGQMSRVDSVELSVRKSKLPLSGSVMASDAFFPFPDSIEVAAQVGVNAVIQPGGSIRDDEVIEAADRHGMTMVLTGSRHFRH